MFCHSANSTHAPELMSHLARTRAGLAYIFTRKDPHGNYERILQLGGVWQSATYFGEDWLVPPFAYIRSFDRLFDIRPDTQHLLMIGGGGFSFPKMIAQEHPAITTDVVEIDPAMIRIARKWFFLDDAIEVQKKAGGSLNVIRGNGRDYLEKQPTGSLGALVIDAFFGRRPAKILATAEAVTEAHRTLSPNGIFVTNIVSEGHKQDLSFLRQVTAALVQSFHYVEIVRATEETGSVEDNYLVLGSDAPLKQKDAINFDKDFLLEPLHSADL
jgi:spermidine synthase